MYIKKLAIKDFRNIKNLQLENLSTGTHIFVGKNAMGKTNLIEAINYLSCGRSFRGVQDTLLIAEGNSFAGVVADYQLKTQTGKVEAYLLDNGKRSIKINHMPVKKVSELMGVINSVVFAPEDLRTIKESPGLRRRMIDVEISKIRPAYYVDLQNFYITLKQKNKILKNRVTDETLLSAYNESLITYASAVITRRDTFIQMLNTHAKDIYKKLSDGAEKIEVQYKSTIDLGGDIKEKLAKKIAMLAKREKELTISLVGPHREDIEILMNGRDIKQYASQGQQRTAMLAIKLACADIAEQYTGEKPILLLDDVFSELDIHRREKLLQLAEDRQIFITATDVDDYTAMPQKPAAVYEVENGNVQYIGEK